MTGIPSARRRFLFHKVFRFFFTIKVYHGFLLYQELGTFYKSRASATLKKMDIIFTKHADKKLKDLKILGVLITKKQILAVLKNPMQTDIQSDAPNSIAIGNFDTDHVLRVVYRNEDGILRVITFYPARKGRYIL